MQVAQIVTICKKNYSQGINQGDPKMYTEK